MIYRYTGLKAPLNKCVEHLMSIENFNTASRAAFRWFPVFVDILKKLELQDTVDKILSPDELTTVIERLKDEADSNFITTNTRGVVTFYSTIEVCVKDLVTNFFRVNDISTISELSKVKVSITEFSSLDETDRYDLIYSEYERSLTQGTSYGIKRFELLLKPIGLSGEYEGQLGRNLDELSQIRNVIAHQNSIVDRHLLKKCPWLTYKSGDKLILGTDQYFKYFYTVIFYLSILIDRLAVAQGGEPAKPESYDSFRNKLNEYELNDITVIRKAKRPAD